MERVIDYLKINDCADLETLFKVSQIDSKELNDLLRRKVIAKYEGENAKTKKPVTMYYLCDKPVEIHIDADIRALFEWARTVIEDIPTPIEIQERQRLLSYTPRVKKRKKQSKLKTKFSNEHLRNNPNFSFLFQDQVSSS